MRTTKAMLREYLRRASEFNKLELVFVPRNREMKVRNQSGFIDVVQYGHGLFPLRGEFGTDGKNRYIEKRGKP